MTSSKKSRTIGRRGGFALVITSHAMDSTYAYLMPILYPAMILEFSLSYGMLGMLATGYRLLSGSFQLLMGVLGTFVKKKTLLGLGMIWQCAANSLMAVSRSFDHALIARTSAGVGGAPQHPTTSSYIAGMFSKKEVGRALGLNMVASHIGGFIAPIAGSLLLYGVGWRTTLLLFSIPGIMIGIAFLLVQEPKPSRGRSDGLRLSLLWREILETLSERRVLALLLFQTVMTFRGGATDFLPSYFVRNLGMTSFESGMLYSLFLSSGIFAPFCWGYLSDRFERGKVVIFAMSLSSVLWFLLPYSRVTSLLLLLLTLGFVNLGVGGVVQALVADSTRQENRDIVYGVFFTISYGIGSLSSVILGCIADSFGFQATFAWVATVSLLAVLIAARFL